MSTCVYTSINFNYSEKAMILAESIKRFHPDWHVAAIVSDTTNPSKETKLRDYFDEVIYSENLGVSNYSQLRKSHSVVELCTAVKGDAALFFLNRDYDCVFYFDPDIQVFSSLDTLRMELREYDILLTPHCLRPIPTTKENSDAIVETEVNALKYGLYNLGFIGFSKSSNGIECAQWWRDRLNFACIDNTGEGYFTDQKWCDHIPIFFDGVLVSKDFGRNVANWNLFERELSLAEDGTILCNNVPLRFYHFTKFGPLGFTMTKKYARDNPIVFSLWEAYAKRLFELTGVSIDYQEHWEGGSNN